MSATQTERDRAARLGRLAAKAGRGVGDACPYDANGSSRQRALSVVFVRAYMDAGGTVDGIDYGDGGGSTSTRTTRETGRSSTAAASGKTRGRKSSGGGHAYGNLGYGE